MTTTIDFIKMQALGNDFVVIDTIQHTFKLSKKQIQKMSDRHFGIGFDQLLIISKSQNAANNYHYQIFNADGSEVGQCGNGARCAAQYIHKYIDPHQKKFTLTTKTTSLELEILPDDLVKLILAPPSFAPQDIPLLCPQQEKYMINAHSFHALSVGNPHAVIIVSSLDSFQNMEICQIGALIENHFIFPERTNVNFVYIQNLNEIHLRVWERGCGETLACGSGALASAAVARKFYHLNSKIKVHLKGGELNIDWPSLNGPIAQIGPAIEVFQGRFIIEKT